jgi:urease accessory protein
MDTPTEMDPSLHWLPLLLQSADALFPTGAYAHSFGFEECVRLEIVHDEATLAKFLAEQAAPALERLDLPYLRFTHEGVMAHDFGLIAAIDEEIGASKPARESREASVSLGLRRLRALQGILPAEPRLAACGRAIASGRFAGHHVTICAFQAAVAGVPLTAALAAYFYQSLAAVAGAALKLIRIGQDGVQRALRLAASDAPGAVERSLRVKRRNAGSFNPLLEIASMRHERAHERLFIS